MLLERVGYSCQWVGTTVLLELQGPAGVFEPSDEESVTATQLRAEPRDVWLRSAADAWPDHWVPGAPVPNYEAF